MPCPVSAATFSTPTTQRLANRRCSDAATSGRQRVPDRDGTKATTHEELDLLH
jgi:hypothetical protein